eukprot:TRINITY_DN365_c0_g1_i1.p2 TRINITY_DN365_c0_g1~~TRINITY_DN365_c0_g1_i1.p2  ORF type:complete len:216 (+),score=32.75 TRINITY_DN365_c0_g1_i1:811-1458(+)
MIGDDDGEEQVLFWHIAPDGHLQSPGVQMQDNASFLEYVSQGELAYFNDVEQFSFFTVGPFSDRIDVRRLDRELRETSVQVCVPPTMSYRLLVGVDGCLMVLTICDSARIIDLLAVDSQRRTHVDVPVSFFGRSMYRPTASEGRLFVPLLSNSTSPQLLVYCFNRGAALLWHACFPLTRNFRFASICLIPDGRAVAALNLLPPDVNSQPFLVLDR